MRYDESRADRLRQALFWGQSSAFSDPQPLLRMDRIMAKGKIFQQYKLLSHEDQRTFDRWLKANAVVGLLLAAGLVAMALAGSNARSSGDAVAADGAPASQVIAAGRVAK